jgi:folate-binding protein YgfZ
MSGAESVDFLQRISTNDFENFSEGKIQKTLFVTDKGRILDMLWAHHSGDHILLIVSKGMVKEVLSFLNKYIIMEDIVLEDLSTACSVFFHFDQISSPIQTDFFGRSVSVEILYNNGTTIEQGIHFDRWRIDHGIPLTKKELVQEYNPLELNLWDWISFTKGCYIGQEVIARLDTYKKIQRSLCRISSPQKIFEQEILRDENGAEAGKITSVAHTETGSIGLAVLRVKYTMVQQKLFAGDTRTAVNVDYVFQNRAYGRN